MSVRELPCVSILLFGGGGRFLVADAGGGPSVTGTVLGVVKGPPDLALAVPPVDLFYACQADLHLLPHAGPHLLRYDRGRRDRVAEENDEEEDRQDPNLKRRKLSYIVHGEKLIALNS